TLSINVNQAGVLTDAVVDYSAGATDLTVATGPTTDIAFTMDGSKGTLLQASGDLVVDVFGFVQLDGSFAIEKSTGEVTLADTDGAGGADPEKVQVDRLLIGATLDTAFLGMNGGTADALGLSLEDVQFGLALMTSKADPARTWTSAQASVGSAEFVGVDGLEVTVTTLSINVNQAG